MGFLFSGNNFITFVKNKFLKTKLNKIKQVVILILTMLLASCSKDTYEELVQETKNPLKVKNLKARDLKKQGNLVKKLDHFKAFTKLQNLNHKTEASSIYDFSIDTNNFKLIENNRVKYYTFKVNRTIDNGMLENLQITKKTDGTYVAKLLQYSLSTSEKALLLSGGRLDVNGKLKVVNIEDPDFLSNINLKFRGDCFDMIITTQENLCALGGHSYGQACPLPPNQQPKPDSYVYTVVSGPCGDSGDNGLGDGVFSPPGGLGNQPLEPLDAFLTSLSAEQQQWLDNQSETTQGNIYSYLNVNNYNTTSSNFISEYITNAILNPQSINDYVNVTPNFRMRKADQIRYPKFTSMVKNLKTTVINNPIILNKLIQYTGLSQSQILNKLTFGQGPQIELIPNLTGPSGPNFGNFDHDTPEVININENFALGIDSAYLESTIQATSFLMAITILHEFVHYGNHLTGFDTNGNEMGNLFEIGVFGVIITKDNAGQFYTQLK